MTADDRGRSAAPCAGCGRSAATGAGSQRCAATPADPERGSATLWLLAGALLLFLAGTAVTVRTAAVAARHRVEAAADLAALAAAQRIGTGSDPCAGAQEIASRNGARVRSCRVDLGADGRSGTVTVSAATSLQLPVAGSWDVSATARAERARAVTSPW